MSRFASFAVIVTTLVATTLCAQQKQPSPTSGSAASAAPVPSYRNDPKFQKAMAEVQEAKPGKSSLNAWKHANKAAGGSCIECLRGMITWEIKLAKWKDASGDAAQLASIATTPNDKFFAEAEEGIGLMLTDLHNPKQKNLEAADQHFRAALALAPQAQVVRFDEGRTLAMLGKNDEASAMFTTYAKDAPPTDHYLHRARHFAANPHLAAMATAPPFTVRTVQGDTLTLDALAGKVVLLDFWASWCGPCRETIPELKAMTEKFAGKPLVVLSVSIDEDEGAWRKAMKAENMTWEQFRDADGSFAAEYGVTAIPHFFAIDTDGILREAKLGAGNDVEGMVRKLLREASADDLPPATPTTGQ